MEIYRHEDNNKAIETTIRLYVVQCATSMESEFF